MAAGSASRVPFDRDAHVPGAQSATLMPGSVDWHCHLGGASYPDEDQWVLEVPPRRNMLLIMKDGRTVTSRL